MRRLALTIILACALSNAVRAGEIHTTGVVATPTPSPIIVTGEIPTTGMPGEIHSTGAIATEASNTVLTIILTIISIVP